MDAPEAPSTGRRAPRVTQATATMGSPDAVLSNSAPASASSVVGTSSTAARGGGAGHSGTEGSSAVAGASSSSARSTRRKPNPVLDFDDEGASSLMEAFPLDVSATTDRHV